jgi:hypothetical protein
MGMAHVENGQSGVEFYEFVTVDIFDGASREIYHGMMNDSFMKVIYPFKRFGTAIEIPEGDHWWF